MTCHIGYLAKYCVVCLNDSGSYLEKEGLTSKNVAKAKLHHWVVYLIPTELEKRTKKNAQSPDFINRSCNIRSGSC